MANTLLYLNVLIVAACGLVYELLAGTLASYVIGDSVTQFSLIIGFYLSALGLGAWLSGFLKHSLARRFVEVELAVALVGGLSAPILFFAFARLSAFNVMLYGQVVAIGTLVGLEIPLLMRILKDNVEFSALVSRVLTFDYIGALGASLVFPLLCVPKLGLVRTSLVFGLCNAAVALWGTHLMRPLIKGDVLGLRIRGVLVMCVLVIGLVKADSLTRLAEEQLYADDVIFAKQTAYQRIVITRGAPGFQLFLNGNLQFSSADEYRYHEALVHPPFALQPKAKNILVMGGGDGLALREILRYPQIEHVTLVDLDPEMIHLAKDAAALVALNKRSFFDPRVQVVNEDAFVWLDHAQGTYDLAIVDFPDPNNFALGKLYTSRFYKMLAARLAPDAAVSVQTTSPLMARASFWCVVRTMEAAGFSVAPYHALVPSFGEWGYALAMKHAFQTPEHVMMDGLRYLDDDALAALFLFPKDIGPVPVEVNRLDNQTLVRYYESEWRRWN